jgi:hypothetical protein
MAGMLRERGCDVQLARIEFTDPRYAERFARFPLRHAYLDIFGMVLPQLRGVTGQIRITDEVAGTLLAGKRCAAVAVAHRYWRDDLRILKQHIVKRGGEYVDGSHFTAGGGPVDSMLALSYLRATHSHLRPNAAISQNIRTESKGRARSREALLRTPTEDLMRNHRDAITNLSRSIHILRAWASVRLGWTGRGDLIQRRALPNNRRELQRTWRCNPAVISGAFGLPLRPSVRPTERAMCWPRTDPQSTVFPAQPCRR